jgi:aspartate/methionine/tyrosine aminotransferase
MKPYDLRISQTAQSIEPFYVMEVLKAAKEMDARIAAEGKPGEPRMLFLNVGEPDFTATPAVQAAAERVIRNGATQYTHATGLPELRECISAWYQSHFGLDVPASRIVVTAGASAALQLATLALIDRGDEILMPDPSYACNRHFITAAGGTSRLIASTPAERFQLSRAKVEAAWGPSTRGVLLASPSNPTGSSIAPTELRQIVEFVQAKGGITLIDELYLGLSYEAEFGQSAHALPAELQQGLVSINSFSKYFNMTGWRLGWLVLPQALVPAVERLAQNLYICPSTVSQHAALACFEPESLAEYERRRAEFKARRDYFVPALNRLGLTVPVMPDGAFYAYADCTAWCERWGLKSSWEFAFEVMQRARIAITPGRDFGLAEPGRYVRFSTANSMAQLQEAIARLEKLA